MTMPSVFYWLSFPIKEEKRLTMPHRNDHQLFSYNQMLEWRGIDRHAGDEPCTDCGGSGVKVYGNTSTWRNTAGGQIITSDVCDKCWGSGNAKKPWINLREIGCVRY